MSPTRILYVAFATFNFQTNRYHVSLLLHCYFNVFVTTGKKKKIVDGNTHNARRLLFDLRRAA